MKHDEAESELLADDPADDPVLPPADPRAHTEPGRDGPRCSLRRGRGVIQVTAAPLPQLSPALCVRLYQTCSIASFERFACGVALELRPKDRAQSDLGGVG
mgnify:CR=1 FL=1